MGRDPRAVGMRWVLVRTRDRGLYNPRSRANSNEESSLIGNAAPMSVNSRDAQAQAYR